MLKKDLVIIKEMVEEFGPEKVTIVIDVDVNEFLPSGYKVYIDGGRTATGADAIEWVKKVDGFGVSLNGFRINEE